MADRDDLREEARNAVRVASRRVASALDTSSALPFEGVLDVIASVYERALREAREERDAAIEALRALADKLDAMEKPVNARILMSQAHGHPYTGPTWMTEREAARAVLAAHDAKED